MVQSVGPATIAVWCTVSHGMVQSVGPATIAVCVCLSKVHNCTVIVLLVCACTLQLAICYDDHTVGLPMQSSYCAQRLLFLITFIFAFTLYGSVGTGGGGGH